MPNNHVQLCTVSATSRPLKFRHLGRDVRVWREESHPDRYVWIAVEGATYFLCVLIPGMTRGDVRRLAVEFVARRGDWRPMRH